MITWPWPAAFLYYCRNERDQQLAAIVNKLGAASAKVSEVYLTRASDVHLLEAFFAGSGAEGSRHYLPEAGRLFPHPLPAQGHGVGAIRRTYTSRASQLATL